MNYHFPKFLFDFQLIIYDHCYFSLFFQLFHQQLTLKVFLKVELGFILLLEIYLMFLDQVF